MTTVSFALFDTPIGSCGIAWSGRGIVGSQLPEGSADRARQRFLRRFPGAVEAAPPPQIRQATARIVALLSGERVDLSDLPLDMERTASFEKEVYAVARKIPPGQTLTYGDIAQELGDKALAREVGQALGRNPFPIVIPCHRVVAANGKLGGFSARGGVDTKVKMLAIEGGLGQPGLFDPT